MKKTVRIFFGLMVFCMGLAFLTCDNPVSLGGAIDASVPVVSINKELGPGPNAFIHGTSSIYINASDDQGIKSVTAAYTYSVPGPDGKPEAQKPVTVPARLDNASGKYVVDIDTKHVKNPYYDPSDPDSQEYISMADGALLVTIVVEDNSGKKTVSSELVYTVKNNPPDISIQIPKPITGSDAAYLKNDVSNLPGVVTDNFIMGIFEDLAGVAKGYPQIKFWPAASDEPGTEGTSGDRSNAGWGDVTSGFDDDSRDGWVNADEGQVTNAKGERGGSFRYYLRKRMDNGKPYDENADKGLSAGFYKLKIRAKDINEIPVEWPGDFYKNKPEFILVELLASGTPPVVTILNPGELYQKIDFTIEAKASLSSEDTLNTAVAVLSLEVSGKKKDKPNEPAQVTLASWSTTNDGRETRPYPFKVEVGKAYYQVEGKLAAEPYPVSPDKIPAAVDGKPVMSYVTFADGNFNFTVKAQGDSGMTGSSPLSLYIDRSPPAVSITGVTPYYSQDNPESTANTDSPGNHFKAYRRWTVNSTIKIGVNSTDSRGNAVDPANNGYMKFKYLLLTDGDIAQGDFETWKNGDSAKTFEKYLYTHPKSVFFDYRKAHPLDSDSSYWYGDKNAHPLTAVTGEDGAYTLSLQTHHYKDANPSATKYLIWFYIVSMDNAGNLDYDKILLNVDEDTDIPVVEFGNLNKENNPQGLTFADETLNIRLNINDDDGLTRDAVEYRFKTDALKGTWSHEDKDDLAWYPLRATPSEDTRTILVTDLSLIRIACDLLPDHPYDENHTMDEEHRNVLGSELDTKVIQVRVRDNPGKKVYPDTDGEIFGKTIAQKFTMDLTSPSITPSLRDMAGTTTLTKPRSIDNPFGAPQKDEGFKAPLVAYGDLVERNFKSFTVIIDGGENIEIPLVSVPAAIPDADPGTGYAAIWKAPRELWKGASWGGELRWRFSLGSVNFKKNGVQGNGTETIWENLADGSHTFMIQFTDKVPRTTVKQVTFFKDSEGPAINFITIKGSALTDDEITKIKGGGPLVGDIKDKYDAIKTGATIKETDAKIIGTFVDGYSTADNTFWYKIDNEPWQQPPKPLDSSGKTANWDVDVKNLPDGFHTISIRVKDSGGNGYDNASPNPPNGPGAKTNIGFILDRKDPVLVVVSPYADKDTVDTVFDYKTSGVPQAEKVITIKGLTGDSSLKENKPVLAAIDSRLPADDYIEIRKLNWRGSFAVVPSAPAPVKWDAYYNNLSKKYFIYNGSSWELLGEVPAGTDPYEPDKSEETFLWTFTLDADGLDDAVHADGSHKVTFSAEDSTGRKITKVWNFVRDNTVPVINIINGAPGNAETSPVIIMDSANQKIQGTVSDAHGKVSKLEVKVEKKTAGAWPASPVWEELAVTNGGWEKSLTSGDGQYRIAVRAYDDAIGGSTAGNAASLAPLYFIIDTEPPKLSDLPAAPFRNSAFTLSGTVTDANTVTISAALDGISIPGIPAPTLTGADSYTWTVPVPITGTIPESSHTVTITAADKAGRTDTRIYNFTYDKTAPGAAIGAPAPGNQTNSGDLSNGRWAVYDSGSWINGVTDIRGTSDDKNGIAKIFYHLGKLTSDTEAAYNAAGWTDTLLDTETPHSGWAGGLYSWTFTDNFNAYGSVPGMIIANTGGGDTPYDFYLPFYVKIEDAAGNRRVLRYTLWVDPDLDRPQVVVAAPSNNSTVGGEVRVSGTASDDDWVYGVQIRIRKGSSYYKNFEDTFIYGESPASDDEKGWVWAHIVGNTSTVVAWYYTINEDGALNPAMGNMTQVEIEARAVDTQDDLHVTPAVIGSPSPITIKFDSNVPTVSNVQISRDNGTTWEDHTAGLRAGGKFIIQATIRDEGGISSIRARETGDPGYKDMLAPVNPKPGKWAVEGSAVLGQAQWEDGWKYCIVDPGTGNNWAEIDAEYTSSKSYKAGATFKYKVGAPSPSGAGATAYRARGVRGTIANSGDPAYQSQYDAQFFEYLIRVTVDSTDPAYYPYGKTGNYSLELQVTDNNSNPAPYMTMAAYNVQVDNYFPTATFSTQYNASTRNFFISGTAEDYNNSSGSVQGIERVLVYFQRGANYMNATGKIDNDGRITYAQGKEGEGTTAADAPTGISKFPVLTQTGGVWKSDHAMVIDRQEITGDGDLDGTFDEIFDGSTVKEWRARFNTTVPAMTDGPITVHYVIMDMAGNAAHYTQDIYIMNHPPIIREFNLGTDINNDGSVASWKSISDHGEFMKNPLIVSAWNSSTGKDEFEFTDELRTGFIARNYRLAFNLNTAGGNGEKHYEISYVTEKSARVGVADLVPGQVYTIETPGSGINWTHYGAPNSFTGTTFVAANHAPLGTTGGEAIGYTQVSTATKTGSFAGGNKVEDILYTGTFNNGSAADFNGIPDSITKTDTTPQHSRKFIIKIYDTTVPPVGAEPFAPEKQLAQAVLINMDISNRDYKKPAATVDPFYWKNVSDNSLYENSRHNGHIELEADLPGSFNAGSSVMDRDPKVSGKISIRGTAEDNNIIDSLWVKMDGFSFTGGTAGSGDAAGYRQAAVYDLADGLEGINQWENNGWKMTAATEYHDQRGHKVNWRLDLDTSKITNVAAADRGFTILALDKNTGNPSDTSTSQTTNGAKTPYYRMDVVPYITEVESRLSAFNRSAPSVYARTAQGRYPVEAQGDITVYGFNFYNNSVKPAITLNGTTLAFAAGDLGTGADTRASWQSVKTNVGAVNSGSLVVTVNGLSSLNNENSYDAEINRQPNSVNNNTLTDDVALDVWQFTEVFKSRSESRYPTMKVGPQGQIGFSFANDYQWFNMPGYMYNTIRTDSTTKPSGTAGFWSQTPYQKAWGGYTHNTFAFDARGNTYGTAINIDEAGAAQSANFSFMNRRPNALPGNMADQDNYSGTLLNGMRLENTAMPSNPYAAGTYIVDVNRIQSPAIVTSMPSSGGDINNTNNRVSVYMAYYDRTARQIRFRAGTVGKDFSATSGSDIQGTAQDIAGVNNRQITVNGHGLTNGTQVYLRSASANIVVNKTVPYYVRDATTNNFNVTLTPGGGIADISNSNNAPVVISVAGGGLVDLSGRIAARIDHTDAKPSSYQTVAASGEYNPGRTITYPAYDNVPAFNVTYPQAAAYGPGPHVAIGVVKNGTADVVVLAWYDEVHNQLVYSYNTAPSGNSAGQWQNNAKVIEEYAGEGVSLAVDSDGGIHLSYYSSNGADLKYAYAPNYGSNFKTVAVDAYLSVGTQSTITVGKDGAGRQVPYISYYATGAAALRVKLAYRDYAKIPGGGTTVAGVDKQDLFTGAWEVTTVPTARTPSDYRISVGVHTTNGTLAPIPAIPGGTKITGSGYGDIPVDPPTRVYGNGTLNPVIGYGTSTILEMAQKK